MKENSNKILVVNSIILYIRLVITAVCGFLSTRFALQALGIVDFGLFSVIGSIITFISIINTIMVSTSHRYIAVAVGKGNANDANKIFNICFKIHAYVAITTLVLALPLGLLYIYYVLNYDGELFNAVFIYLVSVLASIISFLMVPFQGLLTAKERFFVFCIPDIISSILRLILSYLLIFFFDDKVIVYSSFMAFTLLYPSFIYIRYCKKNYSEIVSFKKVDDNDMLKEILGFSTWVGYGAVAYVGKSQGASIVVNAFFNTIMNTALGIANSICSIIGLFAKSIAQPIDPQITKAYATGNTERCNQLLIVSTKITFLVVFFISSPFFVDCHYILALWLGDVPPHAVAFTLLVIIDTLVDSLNSGIKSIIFASGDIKLFQIVPSTLKLLAIVAGYVVLSMGYSPQYLLYAYILFSVFVFVANQWILNKVLGYDNWLLIKNSYIPSCLVVILYLPYLLFNLDIHPLFDIIISSIYLLIILYVVGLSSCERKRINGFVLKKVAKV